MPKKILFMCVANSARSQMAEGLAKKIFGSSAEIQSAGSRPTKVNPLAIQAMSEVGIDLSQHFSKTYDQVSPQFLADMDFVITLCAEEVCPALINRSATKLHWPFPNPAGKEHLSLDEQISQFRTVRIEIEKKLTEFQKSLF